MTAIVDGQLEARSWISATAAQFVGRSMLMMGLESRSARCPEMNSEYYSEVPFSSIV